MRIAVHDFCGHAFPFELSRQLAAQGHEVAHFFFADYPGPKGAAAPLPGDSPSLTIQPLTIDRPYSTQSLPVRLRGNLAYAQVAARALRDFAPDIVLSGNAPTEIQRALIAATHRASGSFVYWMQDFYSLAVSLLLRGRWFGLGRLIGAGYRWLDRRQLRASDAIVLISEGFRAPVARIVGGSVPIHTVPNWGAISDIAPGLRDNTWSRAVGLSGGFTYLYSGTLGLKHDPMLLLQLARALEFEDATAQVVITAAGAGLTALEAVLTETPQANLRLFPLQPLDAFAEMLASADVLVALLEADAGAFSVPSKILSYLCAGRPILLSAPADNLASLIVAEANAGAAVPAGQPQAFVEAALTMRAAPEAAAQQGRNGRAYAEAHFRIDHIARRFEQIFRDARRGRAAPPKSASARTPALPPLSARGTAPALTVRKP